jgi:tripartite-type tricarboxylate transporter receptor subunit TctC
MKFEKWMGIARKTVISLGGVLACTAGMGAQASGADEAFPSRPIKIVVGFPPGGASDGTIRLVALALQRQMQQPVVVENRAGASGAIAAKHVAGQAPNGYTLLYATSSSHAIAPHLNAKLGYDPVKDFSPIALAGRAGLVLTANLDLPAKNIGELVAHARKNEPGNLTYASPGQASSQHLSMVMFSQAAGIEMRHVPYKGSAPGLMDLIGGQVNLMIDNVAAPLSFVRSGKVRALAVTSLERHALLPDVPTMDESGYKGFDVQAWGGIVAPAGVPQPIVDRLNREVNLALADPAVRKSMLESGGIPQGGSAADFGSFIARESAKWKQVIDRAGLKGD